MATMNIQGGLENSKPLPNYQEIVLKHFDELRFFFISYSCKISIIILPHGIKCSMCDLISDLKYCLWAVFLWYRSYHANDV